MSILEGAVVYIDDEYRDADLDAGRFYKELAETGRPISAYDSIPPDTHLAHWDGLALVVVDWNLAANEILAAGADTLREALRADMLDFLSQLLDRYYCPVFIVSNTDGDLIRSELIAAPNFPDSALGTRVRIVDKSSVGSNLLAQLEKEVLADPALSILRVWEKQFQSAKNRMFVDFEKLGADWPVYLAHVAKEDGTDAGYEVVEALYGNLRHRVDPVAFEIGHLADIELPESGDSVRDFLHGRSVLSADRLYASTIMPGDFFSSWRRQDPDGSIWLNLTPACYTVRGRKSGDIKATEVRLHLVRGLPESHDGRGNPDSLRRKRQGQTRSATVDFLYNGNAYKFDFSTLQTFSWGTVKKHRIGRLLHPFIADVQHRHATFLTSEGLPATLPSIYRTVAADGGAPA